MEMKNVVWVRMQTSLAGVILRDGAGFNSIRWRTDNRGKASQFYSMPVNTPLYPNIKRLPKRRRMIPWQE